jgi:hypothetical protein
MRCQLKIVNEETFPLLEQTQREGQAAISSPNIKGNRYGEDDGEKENRRRNNPEEPHQREVRPGER